MGGATSRRVVGAGSEAEGGEGIASCREETGHRKGALVTGERCLRVHGVGRGGQEQDQGCIKGTVQCNL